MLAEILLSDGVRIDGKTLRLGDSKCRLERLFGQPAFARYHDSSYFGGALRVSVGGRGKVDRIVFPLGADGELALSLFGSDPFREEVDRFLTLHRAELGEADISEEGRLFRFPRLGLTLSRETSPADVEKMFRAYTGKKKFRTEADEAYEYARASRWSRLEMTAAENP